MNSNRSRRAHPAIAFFANAALGLTAGLANSPASAQDVASGKTVFAQCTACHSIDGNNGVGPSLQGITNRKAGSSAGFRYSRAMKSVPYNWDASHLDAFIANPQAAVPGNVMPFSGVSDSKARADLVAYLLTLK
jgi:cytochrome c